MAHFRYQVPSKLASAEAPDAFIICQDARIPVHRNIISHASYALAVAYDKDARGINSREVIINGYDKFVVGRLLCFIYHGNYQVTPGHSSLPATERGVWQDDDTLSTKNGRLVSYVKIRAVAETFDVPALRDLAQDSFIAELSHEPFETYNFMQVVLAVHQYTRMNDHSLRTPVELAAWSHIESLLLDKEFRSALFNEAGTLTFGVNLLRHIHLQLRNNETAHAQQVDDLNKRHAETLAEVPTANAHQVTLLHSLHEMMNSTQPKYTDLILLCEGERLRVHRLIVCSISPVLAAACEADAAGDQTGIIEINTIEAHILNTMIWYFYCGATDWHNTYEKPDDSNLQLAADADTKRVWEAASMSAHVVPGLVSGVLHYAALYGAAVVYDVSSLRAHAEEKFTALTLEGCETRSIYKVINKVQKYKISTGRNLMEPLLDMVCKYIDVFIQDGLFMGTCDKMAVLQGFKVDLLRRIAEQWGDPKAEKLMQDMAREGRKNEDLIAAMETELKGNEEGKWKSVEA